MAPLLHDAHAHPGFKKQPKYGYMCENDKFTWSKSRVWLRGVQSKFQSAIGRQISSLPRRARSTFIPNIECIYSLRKWLIGIVGLVRVDVPNNLCLCSWYNSVCRPYWVCIPILTHSWNREVGRHNEHRCHIPTECDGFTGGDFKIRRRRLLRFGHCDATRRCRLWNMDETKARGQGDGGSSCRCWRYRHYEWWVTKGRRWAAALRRWTTPLGVALLLLLLLHKCITNHVIMTDQAFACELFLAFDLLLTAFGWLLTKINFTGDLSLSWVPE